MKNIAGFRNSNLFIFETFAFTLRQISSVSDSLSTILKSLKD